MVTILVINNFLICKLVSKFICVFIIKIGC